MNDDLQSDVINSFGDEWSRFDQTHLSAAEARKVFDEYFSVFPWERLAADATGFDMGCGSGRWAKLMGPRVGHLHCIDPSAALEVAQANLAHLSNVSFHRATAEQRPLPLNSQDFGYALGVLHHVPDTVIALQACVAMLKPGAPFLIYLYYAFDHRSGAYKLAWRCSDWLRLGISRLPAGPKNVLSDTLAVLLYFPLARLAGALERLGLPVTEWPLAYYRKHSFYTMRTDARDRFGTPLEKRYTRAQVAALMQAAGLLDIRFSEHAPYWCAVGTKPA